jgi:hypothetical protein
LARSAAPLRAVGAAPAAVDPEAELAALFAWEAQLQQQLAVVQSALPDARRRYAEAEGHLIFPSVAVLRQRYGPKAESRR